MNWFGRPAACLLAVCCFSGGVRGQVPATPKNLSSASLEELMDIEVTSVSKKEQTLSKTGAAVFVIGQEDIRRSGASNIPDLLRMVPGVQVAQIASNQWAITIRGFNNLYSNKVLVLIDGRTVYVNSFAGVFWDQLDIAPENIERIEVIRGPGGTVWGANAVNGVINIITKSAADTKGGLVTASSGNRETDAVFGQYGGDAGSRGAYRVFGKYFNINKSTLGSGRPASDGWHGGGVGFRADLGISSRDTLSIQAEYRGTNGGGETRAVLDGPPPSVALVNQPVDNDSGDILARWEHTFKGGSSTSIQFYNNSLSRYESGFHLTENSVDVDFEHHLALGSRNDVVWGLDYRNTRGTEKPTTAFAFTATPASRTDNLVSAFVQDEMRLGKSVYWTIGSKFEHNNYTGFEVEPSTQLVWQRSAKSSFWGAASRAIRQPDRFDFGVNFPFGVVPVPGFGTGMVVISGSPTLHAEQLKDFEVGYRSQLSPRLSLDLTTFLSYYENLQTTEPGIPFVRLIGASPSLVIPQHFANKGHARNVGAELSASWRVASAWKVAGGYSLLSMSTHASSDSGDTVFSNLPGDAPRHQVLVRSMVDLGRKFDWDASVKYVSALGGQSIPSYARVDSRLAWHMSKAWELSITGQNLTSDRHFEYRDVSGLFSSTAVTRTAFAKLTWKF